MKISVFTPSHNLKYIERTLKSLLKQTFKDFEWVLLLNGDAAKEKSSFEKKLKKKKINYRFVESFQVENKNIGYLKHECCNACQGEILVELDHDDELTPDCLEELSKAFDDGYDFVYSDDYSIHINNGKEEYTAPFPPQNGWLTKHDNDGNIYHPGFSPSALAFSYIWYAPDHVRAWRKSFYEKIGGHKADLDVCDDYDLVCRSYINGKCHHIQKPLYKYFFHSDRTSGNEKNEKIQELTHDLHDEYIEDIVVKWCDDNKLKKVDLCSCNNRPDGFIGVDKRKLNEDDIVFDLDEPNWPFEDGSIGVFRAHDALEHLKDPINTMKEMFRCLSDYGWVLIEVPSTDGRGAFQDPTHVSFWNTNSFWYYTQKETAHFIGSPVKFQLNRIANHYPTEWHKFHDIIYAKAHLVKLPPDDIIPIHGRRI